MTTRKTVAVPFLVGALSVATAAAAAGQACVGIPQGQDGALSIRFGFPDNAKTYELEGVVQAEDTNLFFTGAVGLTSPDTQGFEDTKHVEGSMAWEVESLTPDASLCPAVGLGYAWVGNLNHLWVPFGVGVGTTVQLGESDAAITPWAMPHFLWSRMTEDGLDDVSTTETNFALHGGLTVSVGSLMFGGSVAKVFEDGSDAILSAFIGAAWR